MRKLVNLICAVSAALAMTACSDGSSAGQAFARSGSVEYIAPPIKPRSTWAEKILPGGQIPVEGFLVAYFDRRHSQPTFHLEETDTVAVSYALDDLHGIDSRSFAAYWIGQVEFEEAGIRTFAINEGHAQSRIFVNGEQIYPVVQSVEEPDSSDMPQRMVVPERPSYRENGIITHHFEPGTHLVEVEYINNWHTTEYKVTISDGEQERLSDEVLRARLNQLPADKIVYANVYESQNRDTSVRVSIPRYREPVVVWLDSYEGIDWTLEAGSEIAAVVIASYAPGSRLIGDEDVPVLRSQSTIGIRTIGRSGECACHAGTFRCEQSYRGDRLEAMLGEKTGMELVGFAGEYGASSLSVARFGPADRAQAQLSTREIEEARAACEADKNPDFDTMLDR